MCVSLSCVQRFWRDWLGRCEKVSKSGRRREVCDRLVDDASGGDGVGMKGMMERVDGRM